MAAVRSYEKAVEAAAKYDRKVAALEKARFRLVTLDAQTRQAYSAIFARLPDGYGVRVTDDGTEINGPFS